MDEASQQVSQVLQTLINAVEPVTVHVTDAAKRGLALICNVVDDGGIELITAAASSRDRDPLMRNPSALTDPEGLKYFQMYQGLLDISWQQHGSASNSRQAASAAEMRALCYRTFKSRVQRAMNAARFVSASHNAQVHDELSAKLDNALSWDAFNINHIATLSDRQPLLLVSMVALTHFGLLQAHDIEHATAVNFVRAIEHHYLPNPYHNSTHAADVTQGLLSILSRDGLGQKFSDLELLALILSAIIHDVGHPGFSNPFLTRTQDEQALMYNDQSPNEALSLSIAFKILQAQRCNIFVNMTREDYFTLRRLMTSIVLGTDMAVHGTILDSARLLQTSDPDAHIWAESAPHHADARLAAMRALAHVADLSNAARPPHLAGMWTRAVYDEFFKQGDAEKELGLDVSPLCDRDTVAIAESQKAFLSYVVQPTFDVVKSIAPETHAHATAAITANLEAWTALAATGDRSAVLNQHAVDRPAELLHLSPTTSPFHSNNQASWGSADMLLLLLNDDGNHVIGEGLELLQQRDREAVATIDS